MAQTITVAAGSQLGIASDSTIYHPGVGDGLYLHSKGLIATTGCEYLHGQSLGRRQQVRRRRESVV